MFNRKKDQPDVTFEDDDLIIDDLGPEEPGPVPGVPGREGDTGVDMDGLTVVGRGVTLEGTLRFHGGATIEGTVRGKVITPDRLDVGIDATVVAELDVGTLVLRGSVQGNVSAHTAVEIHETGKLRGNLKTPALTVHPGAHFHGHCNMGSD